MLQGRDSVFAEQWNLLPGRKVIKTIFNIIDLVMNSLNVHINLVNKNLHIILNNDGEVASELVQNSWNLHFEVFSDLLLAIFAKPFQNSRVINVVLF